MADYYDRPTPGESLVVEPRSRPYERPPELSKLSQVLEFYLTRITRDEVIDNTVQMLDLGVPVELIVESLTLFFVMKGTHSIQNRLLVSPVLHEYIRMLGKQAGVRVVDGLNPSEKQPESAAYLAEKLRAEIEQMEGTDEDDEGVDFMRQTAEVLEEDMGEEETTEPLPMETGGMAEEEEPMPMPTEEPMPMPTEEPTTPAIEEPMQTGLMSRR